MRPVPARVARERRSTDHQAPHPSHLLRTNFTEPPPPTPPLASRGSILSNFFASPAAAAAAPAAAAAGTSTSPEVSAPLSPLAYLSELAPTGPTYAGFNTLLFSLFPPSSSSPDAGASDPSAPLPAAGADAEVAYFSNRLPAPAAPVAIAARTGALSNSLWDDPWEKTVGAKHAIDRLLEEERAGVAQGQKPWRKSDWIDRLKEVMRCASFLLLRSRSALALTLRASPFYPLARAPGAVASHSVPTVDRSTFRQSTSIPPLLLPLPDPTAPPRWYATRLLTVILVTHAGEFEFYESDVWQLRRDRDDPDGVEVRRATSSQSFSGTLTPGR